MKQLRLKLTLCVTLYASLFCSLSVNADEYIRMAVGEKKTIDLPSSLVHKGGIAVWSNTSTDCIKVYGHTSSVDIEVVKYTTSSPEVKCTYSYREDGWSRTEFFIIHIDIEKPTISLSINPSGGTLKKGDKVELRCWDHSDAKIYYTLNGSNPSTSGSGNSSWFSIEINQTCTLKAIATWCGAESDIYTANYTVKEENKTGITVSANPAGGNVSKGTTVSLSASVSGADIYYTLDGSSPSKNSKRYSSGIIINESCTIKAIAYKDGYEPSSILTVNYSVDSSSTPDPTPDPTPNLSGAIEINAPNFPDANFRAYLLEQDYGRDGVITEDEIKEIYSLNVDSYPIPLNISSLKGIEHFTKLTNLYCNGNQLTTLDVSKNTALVQLNCGNNQLTSLDVSKNVALKYLYCYMNQLTVLNVEKNTALEELECNDNQLTELNVSNNTSLTKLDCNENQLTILNVSRNTTLKKLNCFNNQLTELNVSNNVALKELNCFGNQLIALDLSECMALTELACGSNLLAALDMSNNTALEILSCNYNQLTELNVSNNTTLTKLNCHGNQLTKLDVSECIALTELACESNSLAALDVSRNTALKQLNCYNNQLQGKTMDDLISGLPYNTTTEEYKFYVINTWWDDNICTTTQVEAAKAKGWTPYDAYDGNKYTGSDPSGIKGVKIDTDKDSPIFNLNGQRLNEVQKGINIIGGQKIIVR